LKLLRHFIFLFVTFLLTLVSIECFSATNLSYQQVPLKQNDTTKRVPTETRKLTKGGLDDKIERYAKDSTIIDRKNGIMYLYGDARVIYGDFELDAAYIEYNTKTNTIFARGIINERGKYVGRPIFKMGKEASSIADSLTYNTKTSSGVVSGVFTEQEGGFFSGGKTKVQPDNEFHVSHTTYSTCNLPEPHFGIHITKGIATANQIITGPVYLEFERIPMPIGIPFAFFPKPNKRSSGIILPTPGEDATRGFSLTNGGYYLALNDYWDAKFTGNIFTNGSYDLNLATNYTKRYKYNGNFGLTYSSTRLGLEGTPEFNPRKNFNISWRHSQNTSAKPGTTFSASVNAGTSSFFTTTAANATYDINQIAQNTLNSSISYGKVFGEGLFNLTTAFTHSQENREKTITLTLPTVSLNMSTISPFDSKKRIGEQKFYQKLTVGYSLQASNSVSTKENLLFQKDGLKRFKNGFQHNIPISLPFNLFKYFNFNAGTNFMERWYFQTIDKRFIKLPTRDSVAIDTVNGFRRAGEYNLNIGMSTKIFGKKEFRNFGNIKAMRHIMTPTVSFNYKPDFSSSNYSYFKNQTYYTNQSRGLSVPIANDGSQIKRDRNGMPLRYSIFEQGLFGGPSAGKQASIGFSVDNTVELKVLSKNDTTGRGEKKIPIIQGLTFSSAYNFVADSLKLSPVNFSGRSQFTDKLGFNFSGSFNPYLIKNVSSTNIPQYQLVNTYMWNEGKLPRLTNFTFSFDYSLNPEALKSRNKNMDAAREQAPNNGRTPEQIEQLSAISRDPNAFVDFNIPWNIAFSYSFNYSNALGLPTSKNVSNTLNFNGDFNLTPKWKVQFNSGYDFRAKNLSHTSFAIYRDLHCWDLSASWIPFGVFQSYSIDIKVKASVLQDLKLTKRRLFSPRTNF